MSKLIVLDLEAIASPIDRCLYPGVAGRLVKLRSNGWTTMIAANQTDCGWEEIEAKDLTLGCHFRVYREDGIKSNKEFTVMELKKKRIFIDVRTTNLGWFYLGLDDKVLRRYKSIEQAINEMIAVADLAGVEDFILCPFRDGHNAVECVQVGGHWQSDLAELQESNGISVKYGDFLKPGPGMLNRAKRLSLVKPDRFVFVGVKPIDRAAADAADAEFIYSDDWRSGRVTV